MHASDGSLVIIAAPLIIVTDERINPAMSKIGKAHQWLWGRSVQCGHGEEKDMRER